jgi:hypothetical protein
MSAPLAPPVIEADARTRVDGLVRPDNDNIRQTELRLAPVPETLTAVGFVEHLRGTVIPLTFLSLGGIATLAWSAFLLWMLARLVGLSFEFFRLMSAHQ